MSIELNWETLTGGPDGAALAEGIRDFIHTKFQSVPLPRFIKSVRVHEFDFGSIPPDVVLKDICDPLPDFYEDSGSSSDEDDEDDEGLGEGGSSRITGSEDNDSGGGAPLAASEEFIPDSIRAAERRRRAEQHRRFASATEFPFPSNAAASSPGPHAHIHAAGLRSGLATPDHLTGTPFLGLGTSTPGIPGGTANLHYLQSKLAPAGWTGTQTPLAAVAGAQHLNGWLDSSATAGTMPPPSWPPHPQQQQQQQQYPHLALPRHRGSGAGLSLGLPSQQHQQQQQYQQQQQQRGRQGRKSSHSDISVAEPSPSSLAPPQHPLREKHSVSTLAGSTSASRPPTSDRMGGGGGAFLAPTPPAAGVGSRGSIYSDYITEGPTSSRGGEGDASEEEHRQGADVGEEEAEHAARYHEPRPDDMQAVFRIRYAGDVRLMLTAEILLDYPMPSFVGIPVKLNITGLTFDGVGVVAYIRKRVHFCFLSPEDAVAAVGADDSDNDNDNDYGDEDRGRGRGRARGSRGAGRDAEARTEAKAKTKGKVGGLLQEIRVESEIGQREGTKQSLKNVGKVERFVLEQVRRIFEEEFVYPSFWTFLV